MKKSAFLGTGWSFPVVAAEQGLAYAEGPEKVQQSIRLILETEPGERVMRPSFGAGLRRFLMQPNNESTRALIRHDVELALAAFEPRIRVDSVSVVAGDDPALVLIRIEYVHVSDMRRGNYIHPFYLE